MSFHGRANIKHRVVTPKRVANTYEHLQDVLDKYGLKATVTKIENGVATVHAEFFADWVVAKSLLKERGFGVERYT